MAPAKQALTRPRALLALKLFALLASSALALIACEILCRVFLPHIGWRLYADPGLGWSSKEYQQFDPSRGDPKAGGPRLLFIGDSFLAGSGNSELSQRFPIRMAAESGAELQVRILASGGWGSDQQLLALLQKGSDWTPDLVVLGFCANNDISNILSNTHGAEKQKPYFVIDEAQTLAFFDSAGTPITIDSVTRDAVRPPLIESYLLALIRFTLLGSHESEVAQDHTTNENVDPRYLHFAPGTEKWSEIADLQEVLSWAPQAGINHASAYIHENFELNRYQWELLEAILARMKAETDRIGARLMVMLLPVTFVPQDPRFVVGADFEFPFQTPQGAFTFRSAEPRDRLQAATSRLGIEFFDPTADFLREVVARDALEATWPDPEDRHFSDLGHEILARLLREHLPETHGAGM